MSNPPRTRKFINIMMLMRVIGWLLAIESVFMLIPLVVSLIYSEDTWIAFVAAIIVTGGCGLMSMRLRPHSREMGKREAIILTASVWIVFSLFGMIPFLIGKTHVSVTDAFFEAMSGFTTTGLSVIPSLDKVAKSIIAWRCVMQWIGGLGIVIFTLAVLPALNYQGGMQMFNAEASGISNNKIMPRVSSTAKTLWSIYIVLTIIMGLSLFFCGMDVFDAFCYSLSTLSTGGFATTDDGLSHWNSVDMKVIFCIFMFLGSINFGLLFKLLTGKWRDVWSNTVIRWYLGILGVSVVLVAFSVWLSGSAHDIYDVTIDPLFQVIAVFSSTAHTDPDFGQWGAISQCVMVALMFMGACAGSTSGGAKVDRVVVAAKHIRNEFFRIMHPNAVLTVRINGKGTSEDMVQKAIVFLLVYIMVIMVGGIVLVFMGIPINSAFYSILESVSNSGIGINIDGLPTNYSNYPVAGKWLLSLVMLAGRLELYTILLLFTKTFWRK